MEIIHGNDYGEMGCRVMTHHPCVLPLQWHENYELCELMNKPCRFLVDGQYIDAQKGDILCIPERDVHGYFVDAEETKFRIIQFSTKIFLNTNFSIKPIKAHITAGEIDAIAGLREKIDHLTAILEKESRGSEIKNNPIFSMVCESIYFLLMRHFPAEGDRKISRFDRELFFKVIEYVNNHYMEDVNINSVAEQMCISRNRLVRMFELYSGRSLKYYIDELRIAHANRLLNQGSNVTEAAIGSGYQCIRTFNNVYKTHMGLTPSEYIKVHVKNKV